MGEHELTSKSVELSERRSVNSVFKQAKSLAATFTYCDRDLGKLLVDDLNQAAIETRAIGLDASITSPLLTARAERFDPNQDNWVDVPVELNQNLTYKGTFNGFQQWRREDHAMLMYSVEMEQQEVNGRPYYCTLWAPVLDGTITVTPPADDPEQEVAREKEYLAKVMDLTRCNKTPGYREDVGDFLNVIQEERALNAHRLEDLGRAGMDVLYHLDTREDTKAMAAVAGLLNLLVQPGHYFIQGDKVSVSMVADERHLTLHPAAKIYQVEGVGLLEDYHLEGTRLQTTGSWQPAMRVKNDKGGSDYMPFMEITDFWSTAQPEVGFCQLAIQRYSSFMSGAKESEASA